MLLGEGHRFSCMHQHPPHAHEAHAANDVEWKERRHCVPTGNVEPTSQVFCNFLGSEHPLHYSRADDKGQVSIELAQCSSNDYNRNSNSGHSWLSTQQPSPHPSSLQMDPWFCVEIGASNSNFNISGKLTRLWFQRINLSYNHHGYILFPFASNWFRSWRVNLLVNEM